MRTARPYFGFVLLLLSTRVAEGAGPEPATGDFPLEEPWKWAIKPLLVEWRDTAREDYMVFLCEVPGTVSPELRMIGGQLPVLFISPEAGVDYKLAMFDEHQAPVGSQGGGSCRSQGGAIAMTRGEKKFAFVGLKQLTPEGAEQLARKAVEKLRHAGVELSPPEMGKPFTLSFDRSGTTPLKVPAEGDPGQQNVVCILHCWASW